MNYVKYVPMALFTVLFGKLFVVGAAWQDAVLLLILGVYAAFYELNYQTAANKVLHARMEQVDAHLTALYKEQSELKNRISASQAAQSFRPANYK